MQGTFPSQLRVFLPSPATVASSLGEAVEAEDAQATAQKAVKKLERLFNHQNMPPHYRALLGVIPMQVRFGGAEMGSASGRFFIGTHIIELRLADYIGDIQDEGLLNTLLEEMRHFFADYSAFHMEDSWQRAADYQLAHMNGTAKELMAVSRRATAKYNASDEWVSEKASINEYIENMRPLELLVDVLRIADTIRSGSMEKLYHDKGYTEYQDTLSLDECMIEAFPHVWPLVRMFETNLMHASFVASGATADEAQEQTEKAIGEVYFRRHSIPKRKIMTINEVFRDRFGLGMDLAIDTWEPEIRVINEDGSLEHVTDADGNITHALDAVRHARNV